MFLLLVSGDAYTVERQTIEYENGDTGETLFCALCPPGTYVSSPCTRTEDTVCLPCPKEHFTQFWNFLPKCLYCSNCLPHTQCPPGMGAKTIGNTQMDTQCQKCPRGTFSAEKSSRAQCRNHTDCGTLQVLFPGRKWQDNICSPCANLTNGGGLEILRVVLPGIFFHQYVKLSKLERFVHSISGHNRRPVRRRALLLNFITKWIANASAHQLKTLPKHLQRVDLHSMAKKVQQMLKRIDKKVSTCQRLEEKTGRINGIFQE
ncbi:tumor necrosis factor receptor superfamily member 6B-like isoform X2 [Tachysurus fulvidraco]|uniref:tumor necrosis factor receptor superfamily member 6B-like isoform X2 n=1 Tax=Tachysurus fulvidraco TaxID=1234273 RepID=UPI001FF036B8|nr:tumor necrosis factor receptor superfamily member 6B-like isoform X2 [Tachysurus fulvidraco]